MENDKLIVTAEYHGADKGIYRIDYLYAGMKSGYFTRHDDYSKLSPEWQKQIKYDTSFLKMALIWSQNSHAKRRKTGCLIVRDYSIISDGMNGTPSKYKTNECEDENGETKWIVLHAESNAISKIARSNQSSVGATIYTTFSPCKDCAKLILQSGIVRLVYLDQHSDVDGMVLLSEAGIKISRYWL